MYHQIERVLADKFMKVRGTTAGEGLITRVDQLFLLPPSFYSTLSGALVGAATNLLIGLVFEKGIPSPSTMLLSVVFLLVSSALLVHIGLTLENLRNEAKSKDWLMDCVEKHRKELWASLFAALLYIADSILFLLVTLKR